MAQCVLLTELDLAVGKGEIYGFLGPNGAGKTTVIRMLVTLLAPTGGARWWRGNDVLREADLVRSRIGVALQEAALDNKQTGRELLRLQGQLYGLGRREVSRRNRRNFPAWWISVRPWTG